MKQSLARRALSIACSCLAACALEIVVSAAVWGQTDNEGSKFQPTPEFMAKAAKVRGSVVRISAMEEINIDGQRRTSVERPIGSGFVIAANGRILTQARIAAGLDALLITFADGRKLRGEVVMVDQLSDLALIKVDEKNLEPVPVYHSDQLRMQPIFAIVPEVGRAYKVVGSIVQPSNRLPIQTSTEEFYPPIYSWAMYARYSDSTVMPPGQIQRSILLDPQNFGSPVINEAGEAVGVFSGAHSTEANGFYPSAIPIYGPPNLAPADQIISRGRISYGYAGLTPGEFSYPRDFGLSNDMILIASIAPDGPAAQVGLRAGDLITAFNDRPPGKVRTLVRHIQESRPGTSANVRVLRGNEPLNVKLTFGERPAERLERQPDERSAEGMFLGTKINAELRDMIYTLSPLDIRMLKEQGALEVTELSDSERVKFRLDSGVVIRKLAPEIEKAGIDVGDIIIRVNNHAIVSVKQFYDLLSTETTKLNLLLVTNESAFIATFRDDEPSPRIPKPLSPAPGENRPQDQR